MIDPDKLLREAYAIARKSRDQSVQNGALLVRPKDGQVICGAANNFPKGVEETEARLQRPLKYAFVEHAERATIFKAARHGAGVDGTIMVCPWFACPDCARAICLSGVKHVIGHKQMMDKTPDRWREPIVYAFEIFAEYGVTYELYDGPLHLPFSLKFDGDLWIP